MFGSKLILFLHESSKSSNSLVNFIVKIFFTNLVFTFSTVFEIEAYMDCHKNIFSVFSNGFCIRFFTFPTYEFWFRKLVINLNIWKKSEKHQNLPHSPVSHLCCITVVLRTFVGITLKLIIYFNRKYIILLIC